MKASLRTRGRGVGMRWIGPVVGLVALALTAPAASAAVINVTTTEDQFDTGSRCSLREAIQSANADSNSQAQGCVSGSGSDTIKVPDGRYVLRQAPTPPASVFEDANLYGDLDITAPVTITHSGLRPAAVDGNRADRVFDVISGGVTMQGLQIQDGNARNAPVNNGGGILDRGQLTLRNVGISFNDAVFGGGLSTLGAATATLQNVTIAHNGATEDGGGMTVETGGTVSMKNVTVSQNVADEDHSGGGDGGGVFASTSGGGGILQLKDSLIAGNTDTGGEAHDCAKLGGSINSLGHNLVGNTNGCSWVTGPGDVLNRSSQALPLAYNGGTTQTVSLRKTSPAIDKGASCLPTDQRGVKRKQFGGRCDIGAWELGRCQGVVINIIGTSGPELLTGNPTADGILAGGGNDVLQGKGGNDGLCGEAGNDRLEGGPGRDHMDGGPGKDTCIDKGKQNTSVRCELPRHR
jgi:CSLREA domain-containing protein